MKVLRCLVCRRRMPTLKYLTEHYMRKHSKLRLVKFLMKFAFLQNNSLLRRRKRTNTINNESCRKTMYMDGNFKIIYGANQIMIGDGDDKMELRVENISTETKEEVSCSKENIKPNEANMSKDTSGYCSDCPDVSSDSSSSDLMQTKKRLRRRKSKKHGYYQINITKLKDNQSLSEEDGQFYVCHCRENNNSMTKFMTRSDMKVLASDTDSCSDTGKQFFMPIVETKLFCKICGSGYKTTAALDEHMSVHETICNLCNISFSDEFVYKEHMRLHVFKLFLCHVCKEEFPSKELLCNHFEQHVTNRILENVLDMEEEYGVNYAPKPQMSYDENIENIISYLKEGDTYCYNPMKMFCDICGHELFVCDYEQHVQTHHIFSRL